MSSKSRIAKAGRWFVTDSFWFRVAGVGLLWLFAVVTTMRLVGFRYGIEISFLFATVTLVTTQQLGVWLSKPPDLNGS
jgi:hypothetical protein